MEKVMKKIKQEKLVAIIRADNASQLEQVAASLYNGGFRLMEITLNTGGALEAIERVHNMYEDLLVGAGTVLDAEAAGAAIEAGAAFLLAPTLDEQTIKTGYKKGVPVIPGIMTPTEALAAYRWGAEMVKVFPARSAGRSFARDLKGPLPFIQTMAVGGVKPDNTADFLSEGWDALGVGTALVNRERIEAGRFQEIEQLAGQFVEARNKKQM